ncbi:hypothetical protein ElyMa_005624300 [Elysia marginata]|uniref:Uncharacterized protein n=1 Tax=Elysia marginata TaxID=1093978 RepID=A0AAV4F7Y6_9GAST|nr:hypothetical protein ElyMa_005624300 [Elysia marginata]
MNSNNTQRCVSRAGSNRKLDRLSFQGNDEEKGKKGQRSEEKRAVCCGSRIDDVAERMTWPGYSAWLWVLQHFTVHDCTAGGRASLRTGDTNTTDSIR